MISQARASTNPRRRTRAFRGIRAGLLLAAALLGSCGRSDNAVDPNDRLCNGEAGLGVLIHGGAEPLELCLDDGDVPVILTDLGRYEVAARFDTPGGAFQLRMVFALRPDFPVSLEPVATLDEAAMAAGKVWIYYEEVPHGGDAIGSLEVTGGSFRLGFSDENVLAGTFEDITLTMHDLAGGEEVGTRTISEAFFSLSVKSPAP